MTPHDKSIIAAISKNPENGFRMLLAEYKEAVYWHIRRLVVSYDDAQDATQETFVRVFRSLSAFRGDCSLKAWIYRIATNEALRQLSTQRKDTVSLESESSGAELVADDGYIDFDDKVAVDFQRAILTLPPKQQLAFNLRYYDEMSFEEIAKIANSTASSMKANFHLAKIKIKDYLNSLE